MAIEITFLYKIVRVHCNLAYVKKACMRHGEYTSWAVPLTYRLTTNCGPDFNTYCMTYIIPLEKMFFTLLICAALICICLVNYLICIASHFAYFNRQQSEIPRIPRSSYHPSRRSIYPSRSLSRSPRSRSRISETQSESESDGNYDGNRFKRTA